MEISEQSEDTVDYCEKRVIQRKVKMHFQCGCHGGNWGVTVCWHCFRLGTEKDVDSGEVSSRARGVDVTREQKRTVIGEYDALLDDDNQAELRAEALAIEREAELRDEALAIYRAENVDNSYYEGERWDNMEEYERLEDSGWPYSDDD
ncbi:MAG: hypothetical protein OXB89_05685 [Anaerolineaceae bacterium]|nr:hypothetical protein [Anaerolineaceae bacterium]